MIDPSTGELAFNGGSVRIGPQTTPAALERLGLAVSDAAGPDLVPAMRTKGLSGLRSDLEAVFTAHFDFLKDELTAVRLMALDPAYPPDLTDWDLKREMARHDFHCLWVRKQLGWLWRLRRPMWGRVQALCGRNLDETPRLSIVKVTYVDFAAIEEAVARDYTLDSSVTRKDNV
ncbi:MAG: hypothetical protein HY553_08555 [Elusimicrobia bacterium]|nr:hypothetical protein [Elusimicrobiota bacterium]